MKLKELRKDRKFTQADVAKYLDLTIAGYNGYETEKRTPSISTLIKLADFYHTSIDYLVGRETNLINLEVLPEEEKTLIQKILNMSTVQKAQTINFVNALTLFDK